jgi:hypothetical protein
VGRLRGSQQTGHRGQVACAGAGAREAVFRASAPTPDSRLPTPALHWSAAIGVLCLAFLLRFYELADRPLGIWFDPAYNGLDALRIMQRGGHVLFFPTNGGRESLFIYLLIPPIWIFGATPFSMRLVTALMGVLHVALLFGFLYDLPSLTSPDLPTTRRMKRWRLWLAVIGSLVLATCYWHLVVSHRAQRALMVPLLAVPILWFFLKGWHTGRKRWFALSGLAMGLEAYTYGAGRLLPVILVVAILPDLVRMVGTWLRRARPDRACNVSGKATGCRDDKTGRCAERLVGLGVLLLTGLVVFLPMGWYFLTHQAQFSERASSVMVWQYVHDPAQVVAEMGRNTLRVLAYFCCVGGTTLFDGLPGYPGLSPLLAPFLAIGLVGAIVHSRSLVHRLMWCWWVIGLVPSIASIEAPHQLRLLVAIVPMAALIALAPVYLRQWLTGRRVLVGTAQRVPCLIVVLTLAALPFTWRAYFVDWVNLKDTHDINDYAALAVRDEVLALAASGVTVYLPMSRLDDPPLLYYLAGSFSRQASLGVPKPKQGATADTATSVCVIAPGQDEKDTTWVRFEGRMATILPPLMPEGLQEIQAALNSSSVIPLLDPDGNTAGWRSCISTDPGRFSQQPLHNLSVSFGPARLTGINYPATIAQVPAAQGAVLSGDTIPVTSYWQAESPMRDEYEVLLHLVDDKGRAWGNGDGRPTGWVYPTTFWRPGLDTIAAQQNVSIRSQVPPPGRYWLAIALYDAATGRRLPMVEVIETGDRPSASDSQVPFHRASADTYLVGPLKMPLPPPDAEIMQRAAAQDVTFGDVARLVGVVPDDLIANPGQDVHITLLWRAVSTPAVDYTVFVHLLDSSHNVIAGSDSQPVANTYPTTIWSPGEMIADTHTIRLVKGAGGPIPPGQYRLSVGLYELRTGERLPVQMATGESLPDRELVLDQVVQVHP